jgi:hypothetical protein
MTDDGGVLGNLPNSRPGKRSEKRERPAKAPAQRKRTAAVKKPRDPVPPSPGEDPVGAVVRTGLGIAGTGVKVAGALSRELFKRLPRP